MVLRGDQIAHSHSESLKHTLDPLSFINWLEAGLSQYNVLNLFVYYMGWNLLPARSREAELYIVGKPMHL